MRMDWAHLEQLASIILSRRAVLLGVCFVSTVVSVKKERVWKLLLV
jgi:hypothetical protein